MNTTVLPAAIMPMELQMTVSLGFVQGVMAPMTPKGPISISVRPLSPDQAVVVRSSVPGVLSATRRCLRILCPTLPMPVSSTPIRAKISAFSWVFLRILPMICSLWSRDILRIRAWEALAAAMALFISVKMPCFFSAGSAICIFAITSCTMSCTRLSFTSTLLPPHIWISHRRPVPCPVWRFRR